MTTCGGCRSVRHLLEAFTDGELPAEKILEVEQHLSDCAVCAERVRLDRSVQLSVRRCVRSTAVPSAEFLARVQGALCAERDRESRDASNEGRSKMLPWRTIVPVAAAAGFTLAWAASNNPTSTATATEHTDVQASIVDGAEQFLEKLVDYHARGTPVQVTDVTSLDLLERETRLPVPYPNLKGYGANWQGAGVIPVNDRRAATMRYELDGHRITVYVYDSAQYPLRATLEARVVRDAPVYVGTRRGYSIAAIESRGVGCALATDLNDRESAELAAAIPCTRSPSVDRSPARPRGMVPTNHQTQYVPQLMSDHL